MQRKGDLIERDSRGMLEVLSPRRGMDAVGVTNPSKGRGSAMPAVSAAPAVAEDG